MVATICKLGLFFTEEPDNLKRKRQILRSIKDRLKNRFDISVAEVEMQDKWQRSVLGIAFVSLSEQTARKIVSKILDFIEFDGSCEVFDKYEEFYTL